MREKYSKRCLKLVSGENILTAQESSSLSLSMHGSVEDDKEEASAFCSTIESHFFASASAYFGSCFGPSSVHIIRHNSVHFSIKF